MKIEENHKKIPKDPLGQKRETQTKYTSCHYLLNNKTKILKAIIFLLCLREKMKVPIIPFSFDREN